jgi:methylenetetrahydrofolate dehydrogenase (NADP+)/methenyltetrahydrofolate cyclohydrolase
MVKADWVKPGAIVIDVGMNRIPAAEEGKTKLVGDVDFAGVSEVAGAITAGAGRGRADDDRVLLRNTIVAAHRNAGSRSTRDAI